MHNAHYSSAYSVSLRWCVMKSHGCTKSSSRLFWSFDFKILDISFKFKRDSTQPYECVPMKFTLYLIFEFPIRLDGTVCVLYWIDRFFLFVCLIVWRVYRNLKIAYFWVNAYTQDARKPSNKHIYHIDSFFNFSQFLAKFRETKKIKSID